MFTELEANHYRGIIAKNLSNSVVNSVNKAIIAIIVVIMRIIVSFSLLKSVPSNSIANFVLFAIVFSSNTFTTSAETLKKREAATLQFSTPAIITSYEVTTARYDANLDRSDGASILYWYVTL